MVWNQPPVSLDLERCIITWHYFHWGVVNALGSLGGDVDSEESNDEANEEKEEVQATVLSRSDKTSDGTTSSGG